MLPHQPESVSVKKSRVVDSSIAGPRASPKMDILTSRTSWVRVQLLVVKRWGLGLFHELMQTTKAILGEGEFSFHR